MNPRILYITVLFSLFLGKTWAQLSPGELSNAHKDLEGVSNCTQCHDIGSKVSNNKCLSCHKEIKNLVDRNQGFHVSNEVKSKDCAKCHSDHHGRKFDMVRFDEKNFNHNLAGYDLTGKHKQVDCRKCHQADNVEDWNLKKRNETFLGLKQGCNSCHKDVHQKTLGNDCAKCHTTDDFAPASKFNHDKTHFALLGKHKTVNCLDCHQKEMKNGADFQRFAGVPFKSCNSCHKDPHDENLGNNCKECHNETAFSSMVGLGKFNHSRTAFPLKGKHKQQECRECHQMNVKPLLLFQDRLGVKTESCSTCHKDVHEGKFGANCAECHTEDGFKKVANLGEFDHDRTAFALEGKHEAVDCKKCHVSESMTDPLPHNTCGTCHKDFHEGQMITDDLRIPDCAECHTVDAFAGSTYGIEQHAKTKFPLDGGHAATPCFACHKPEQTGKWTFRGLGKRCVDCHKDVHNGQIPEKWYPNQTCEKCHQTTGWRDNKFDHSKTEFALKGQHAVQDCRACHVPKETFKYGQFVNLPAKCQSCHEDEHGGQFENRGTTDCAKCHGFEAWEIENFDHTKTRFKLEGKHAEVDCVGCHKTIAKDNKPIVQYKFENFECVVCHQ